MPEQKIILSVRNLSKKFTKDIRNNMFYGIQDMLKNRKHSYTTLRKEEFWGLKDINFDLYEGEILAIVGANGSGKTSLMRIISGVYPCDMGQILGLPQQKITSIFALTAGMQMLYTGWENIFLKGALYGMKKEEIENSLSFIEEFSELGSNLDRPLGNYSSGMKARLAYSIALATQPDVFIIDEALAVGDSVFRTKCFEHLKTYAKQPKKGVLLVSNHIRKVLKTADRLIVIDKGEMILNSSNVKEGLLFYINHCLRYLSPELRKQKLEVVQNYDL